MAAQEEEAVPDEARGRMLRALQGVQMILRESGRGRIAVRHDRNAYTVLLDATRGQPWIPTFV